MGKDNAFFSTWGTSRRNVGVMYRGAGIVNDIRAQPWRMLKQKLAAFSRFDPEGQLFRTGAHAPLMVWLGDRGRRSEDALWEREQGMIWRNWGPGSLNRSRFMQAAGLGP